MPNAFASARLWLASLDPAAPAVALMLGVFLTIYLVRRFFPRAWLLVEKTVPFANSIDPGPAFKILWKSWQALPAAALGAVVTALSSGGSAAAALKGALLGASVAVIHEIAAAYKGKMGTPKPSGGAGVLGACLALCLALPVLLSACIGNTPAKSIADIARDLCSVAFSERHAAMSPTDVAKSFCATEEQLAPFIQQLAEAKHAALAAPPVDEAKKAPLKGCPAVIESSKRMACGFESPDPVAWCAALPADQVACLTSTKTTSCLAFRQCTEVVK